jgi:hypothetical protein
MHRLFRLSIPSTLVYMSNDYQVLIDCKPIDEIKVELYCRGTVMEVLLTPVMQHMHAGST